MLAAPPAVVHVQRIAAREPGALLAASRDGRLAVFTVSGRRKYAVLILNLRDGRRRIVGRGDGDPFAPALSPDGRRVTFIRRRTLYVVSTSGGRPRALAHVFAPHTTWLDDGRIAAHLTNGELTAVTLDGTRRLLARGVSPTATISPDARYVLDSRRCSIRLIDRARGTTRIVARAPAAGFGPVSATWSSDSRHYALTFGGWEDHCTRYTFALWGAGVVRDVAGARSPTYDGFPVWSADGRYVLLVRPMGGTGVTYLTQLDVLDVRTQRLVHVFGGRVSDAVASANGVLVYGRYDATQRRPDFGGPLAPLRLYTATLQQ